MRLIDHYRADIAGLSTKQAKPLKALWHRTAKRYLNLLSITSDPVPEFEPDHEGIVTKPVDAYGIRFFLKRPVAELVELYRVTKPKTG